MSNLPDIRFIDVFAGCGGLSLGLLEAGCQGLFAIERSPLAFETLRFNLVDGINHQFSWPEWLPKQAMTCENLLQDYPEQLTALKGKVDLIVGGPPCQGFSTAGRRDPADPRNQMTEQYLKLVELIQPQFLVIENVAGFNMRFEETADTEKLIKSPEQSSYAEYVAERLTKIGYTVSRGLVNCADFGVPQNRLRYLMLCERTSEHTINNPTLLNSLTNGREDFLRSLGLPTDSHITTKTAIQDLETKNKELVENKDSGLKGYFELKYTPPTKESAYLQIMRKESGIPNSMRLAKHRQETIAYFEEVQKISRPGFCMSQTEREQVGTKKHSTTVLDPNSPAPTITTLPDDFIHYSEPRILTVREHARLQSFPDWFEFKGKYTTGGKQRKQECPRYTQVGNAVPPLLATAVGYAIKSRRLLVSMKKHRNVKEAELVITN